MIVVVAVTSVSIIILSLWSEWGIVVVSSCNMLRLVEDLLLLFGVVWLWLWLWVVVVLGMLATLVGVVAVVWAREAAALRHVVEVAWRWTEHGWISLVELLKDFLTVLELHQGRLKALDGQEDFVSEVFIIDGSNCFLEDVVSELIIDKLLDNEIDSCLQIWLSSLIAKLVDNLEIVLRKGSFEDLLDVCFLSNVQALI